ncbi:hypothetical protein [Hyphomicrobium sp.]|uniref:hypothetical protein n=1 Tax=Hyphomicrobium sp. TaxID=82 RepID=UPI003F712FE6
MWVAAACLMAALAVSPGMAGDGEVLHVGETTTLHLEGQPWVFDGGASRQARLVSVKSLGASASAQKFQVKGLKAGQVMLVFRSGSKTFQAHIDVLN